LQKNIIKRAQVELAEVELQRPPNSAEAGAHRITKKRAILVEDEGRPIAVEVTCSCGEVTLVELELGPVSSGAAEKTS
jgi:hypothetical protein